MWVAMEDVDRANGSLSYLPGSHRRGLRPHDASHVKGFSQSVSDFGPGPGPPRAVTRPYLFHSKSILHGLLCGRAGHLTAKNGGFRPGRADDAQGMVEVADLKAGDLVAHHGTSSHAGPFPRFSVSSSRDDP
jgi:ectoine hydroxylase-related dioxygenase (phytanoyl-CoA dioxygenase family)